MDCFAAWAKRRNVRLSANANKTKQKSAQSARLKWKMSERPGDAIAPLGPNIGTIAPSGSLSKTIQKTITLTAQMEEHRISQHQPSALTPAEMGGNDEGTATPGN